MRKPLSSRKRPEGLRKKRRHLLSPRRYSRKQSGSFVGPRSERCRLPTFVREWLDYLHAYRLTNLSDQALKAARSHISSSYGKQYLPKSPVKYSNSKDAQEAHEAIRPSGEQFKSLPVAQSQLAYDEFRLYELIWKRTVASQMLPAKGERLTAKFSVDKATLTATGKSYTFQGFRLASRGLG